MKAKYKELYCGPHRLRQYVGSSVVKVTLRDAGTYETCGPLTADTAFRHVSAAWRAHASRLEAEDTSTPEALRNCVTLAEVNARRNAREE